MHLLVKWKMSFVNIGQKNDDKSSIVEYLHVHKWKKYEFVTIYNNVTYLHSLEKSQNGVIIQKNSEVENYGCIFFCFWRK